MDDKLKDFLSFCSEIDFGAVNFSNGTKEFYSELNNEIISLCKSLPKSTQTDALFFIMRYFQIPVGQKLDFFRDYYVPAWSIIYWLAKSHTCNRVLGHEDLKSAITAHTMALFLHSLDDHLNDNEIPVTHLTMLLRSQSWMIMNHAIKQLADGVGDGQKIAQSFIDDYYSGIRSLKSIESLDSYCELFGKQMATGFIIPFLMTKKMGTDAKITEAIMTAYKSFGISWRLLDDINDIQIDIMKGTHSSIYTCLPEHVKRHWDEVDEERKKSYYKDILVYIMENGIVGRIRRRIFKELESAASILDSHSVAGLADEFRCLSRPLLKTM